VVNESRLGRGSGEDVTYFELRGDDDEILGILTTVVYAAADGDDPLDVAIGLFEIGIEELRRTLPSIEVFRRESGRLKLESLIPRVIDGGPLSLVPL
jgi:hypothetical protein